MSALLYVIPNGRGAKALLCQGCLEAVAALPEDDCIIRCDVGLHHAYVCKAVTRGWLSGCRLCHDEAVRVNYALVVHTRRLRAALDAEGRQALDGFLGLLALARG